MQLKSLPENNVGMVTNCNDPCFHPRTLHMVAEAFQIDVTEVGQLDVKTNDEGSTEHL